MKRFCFNAFVVDDENREAFEVCRDVARLDTADSTPIVIVGDHGSGKTHLLRAIAEEIREFSSRAGIVYVRSDRIPDSVRQLVKDPKPIDLAQQAVLLVDDLHRFTGDHPELAKLIAIFLENEHQVVCASREPLEGLHAILPELKDVMSKARMIGIGTGDVQRNVQLIEARILQDTQETISRQEQEIDDLRARLSSAYPAPKTSQDEGEMSLLRECVEELTVNLSEAREHLTNTNSELDELRAAASIPASTLGDETSLHPEFEDVQKTREEARLMLERAERLTEQMHEARVEFVRVQEERAHNESEIGELEKVYSRAGEASHEAEPQPEESLTGEPDTTLQAELAALHEEREAQQREREQLEESIVHAHSERDTMKSLLQRLRNERDEARADLDQARAENMEQAAAQRAATEKLTALHSQLLEGPVLLQRLMELFGLPGSEEAPVEEQSKDSGASDGDALVEPESFEHSSEVSILRPDFGDGARPPVPKSSSLHHVEELGARLEIDADDITLEDTQSQRDEPQSRNRSA